MVRTVDLTRLDTESDQPDALGRLAGLRALVDMPAYGFSRDPGAPIDPSLVQDIFCQVWQTIERCDERIAPTETLNGCAPELAATPYPAGFVQPQPWIPPAACSISTDLSDVANPEAGWFPFTIHVKRTGDMCELLTNDGLRAQARGRLGDMAALAVLRQLWGTGDPAQVDPTRAIEPRGLNLGKIMRNESAVGGPSDPHGAWGTLVNNVEQDDWFTYTLLAPSWALPAMIEQHLARPGPNGGWVDPYGQPIILGGQFRGWTPTSLARSPDAPVVPDPAAPGEGYMVAVSSPIWFALSTMDDRDSSGAEDQMLNAGKAEASIRGLVMTRQCNVYGVRTRFHSVT